ncbi:PAS domain S-box protein [Halohasta salina]|uniref:PAS domain S-box protein n=1 Tax=Halohasta salina TaxID=2961621 RepID=UPI0020A4FBC2|nr:PAS domain S-box protein [Halohasta salina]
MEDVEAGFRTLSAVVRSTADVDRPLDEKIRSVLETAAERLGFPIAYFTDIDDRNQRIVTAVGDHDEIYAGAVDPLEETYCRKTIAADEPVVVADAEAEGWTDDPAYKKFGLSCYLGAPVTVDGETYGTVCFADDSPRPGVDSTVLETTVELLARIVGYEIARTRAETAVQRREQRYRNLFEGSRDALLLMDREGFRECNDAALDLFGVDRREQLVGLEPTDVVPPTQPDGSDSATALAEHVDTACVDGETFFEWQFSRPNGECFRAEVKLSRIGVDDDTLLHVHIRDISDRKERRQNLRLFRKAVEQAGHSVVITDNNGVIQYVNPAFESQTGYSRTEAVGRTPAILKSGKQSAGFYAELWETILDGEIWEADIINRRKSGELYQVRQEIAPIETDGEITHFVAIQSDVTTRRLREQQLDVLNRVLRHNIRNGMNVILGRATFLADEIDGPAATHAEAIETKADALASVGDKVSAVRSLLDEDYPDTTVDAGQLVSTVAESYRERHPEATIRTWPIDDATITADERVEVALGELIENAIVHNDRPEPTVTITVDSETAADGEWVDIVVADDGPGIPTHEQVMIESERETQLEHGSGLALWIVYWTASLFGGEIMIDDRSPRGARVTLRLPKSTADE